MTILARVWRPVFISTLRDTGNVREAAMAAGITRQAAYAARQSNPDFCRQWDDALEDACDLLETKAWKRAQDTSDTLLIFLLKAHRPAKYRETVRQEITGKDGDVLRIKLEFGDGLVADVP